MLKIRENTEDGEFFSLVKKQRKMFFILSQGYMILCVCLTSALHSQTFLTKESLWFSGRAQSMESEGLRLDSLWEYFLYLAQKLTIFFMLFTNMMLSTSLILAVCRTHAIYELQNGLCTAQSLYGSVSEHQSAESEGLRFNSS